MRNLKHEIERLFTAMDTGVCISELIADDERRAGREVIRPGEAYWLPIDDWGPGTVCSLKIKQARLVLLHATQPGSGAFTRAIATLLAEGMTPIVVSPTREFGASLKRRGWRHRGDNWRLPQRRA